MIITVEEARKILEENGKKYTDEQIQKLIEEMEKLSKILLEDSQILLHDLTTN